MLAIKCSKLGYNECRFNRLYNRDVEEVLIDHHDFVDAMYKVSISVFCTGKTRRCRMLLLILVIVHCAFRLETTQR